MLSPALLPEEMRAGGRALFPLQRMRMGRHGLLLRGAGLAGEGAVGACQAFEGGLSGLASSEVVTKFGDSLSIEPVFGALSKCLQVFGGYFP